MAYFYPGCHILGRWRLQVQTGSGPTNNPRREDDGDLAVAPAKPKLKRPPLFKVVLLNDDYTPMEFVVEILESFFSMNREKATQVMLMVHTKARAFAVFTPGYRRDQSHPGQYPCQRQWTSATVRSGTIR